MLPYLCGGVVMNDPFALSLIFVVPLLSVYLVIKLIFTYIALSIDNHILLKVNVDAFKYKQKLTKCFLFGFSSDLLSLIITMLVSNFKALDYINMMFFAGGNVEYLLGIVISYFFTFIIFFYFVFYATFPMPFLSFHISGRKVDDIVEGFSCLITFQIFDGKFQNYLHLLR